MEFGHRIGAPVSQKSLRRLSGLAEPLAFAYTNVKRSSSRLSPSQDKMPRSMLSDSSSTSVEKIVLEVGERRFVTTRSTLTLGSTYFSTFLSEPWANPGKNHSIDADPDLFSHILRYLRRGLLPIFYDAMKGHDHALYLALLEEARYFQIPRLETWLSSKSYLDAVTT